MAYRKELFIAGVLLLLSLLQSTQSASLGVTNVAESDAVTGMEKSGKDALNHLLSLASLSALTNRNESHSVGCIREPMGHERLNCTLLSTFSSYLETASGLGIDKKMRNMLKFIIHQVKDRENARCAQNNSSSENTCKEIFHKNLENLRSVLQLYIKWIVKPME